MKRILIAMSFCCGCFLWIHNSSVAAPKEIPFTAEQLQQYEKEVLPILKQHCYKCHAGEKVKGGFNLETRNSLLEGGDSGAVINLQKHEDSIFIKAIQYSGEYDMPPSGKLPEKERNILTKWVHANVPMPAGKEIKKPIKPVTGVVTEEAKKFWAYQPVRHVTPPPVQQSQLVTNAIDAFILKSLEAKGLTLSPKADRRTLIRRAYFDLIGLPPTPAEVDQFVQDDSKDAYARLVDRLLDSPHYGEKWGRFWLDIVHFAETNGYERDGPKPNAFRYRDYVIRSFNQDKPYNQFLKEQLAGDEMPGEDMDRIIATGFYRLGTWDDEPADPLEARALELDDFVATVGQAFLGTTMNCARCHDHKIDPIPQTDYYRLLAFFEDVPRFSGDRNVRSSSNQTDISPPEKRKTYEAALIQRQQRLEELRKQMETIENEAIKKMSAEDQRASEGLDRPQVIKKVMGLLKGSTKEQYLALRKERQEIERTPEPERDMALSVNNCIVNPPKTHLMIRGNPHAKGTPVEPGFPTVLGVPDPVIPKPNQGARTSGRRTVLANWITSEKNPLTARVMVNRLWQGHFGKGIVGTPNDFGKYGEAPTHPDLLDWLAQQLIAQGWKMKAMHRLMMLSNTYQQSSAANAQALQVDPANQLLWRYNMRRLTAEEVRDSILNVSGKLNLKQFGPSIYPPIPKAVLAGQSVPGSGWHTTRGDEANRRSIYVHIKRSLQVPILIQHDQADPDTSCPVRYTTTVPTQSLGMLNGEFTNEQAEFFAERLKREAGAEVKNQIELGIRLTANRSATAEEIQADLQFVASLKQKHQLNDAAALKHYCLLLLNTNEFIYLD